MKTIHLILLAVLLSLSACSFSFSSGPGAYAVDPGGYPGPLAMVHGPGKPARRVEEPVAQRPAKPAKVDPAPAPVKKPTRVGRKDPAKPKIQWAGVVPTKPAPKATFVGKIPSEPAAPKATFVGEVPTKPVPKATFVGKVPTAEPVPLTGPKFQWGGNAAAPRAGS